MAKAWKDVIASQQYQALAPEQKAQAQEQYFNEVVAPQAGNDAEQAKQAFYAAYPPPTTQQPPQPQESAQPQQQGGFMSDLGNAAAETGRGLLQAGVNLANIPASMADAVTSAGAWAGKKIGIGDGTYQPAPRVTTQGLEQDFGLQQGALTPQTTEGKIFAEALPYLTPVGAERIATQAPTIAGRVAQGASRLLAENAVGSMAANSEQNDPSALAADLGVGVVAGGAVNTIAKGIGSLARGVGRKAVDSAGNELRNAYTQGVQSTPLEQTAKAVSESPDSSILSRNVQAGSGSNSVSITPQAYRAAEEVRPNQDVIDAAKRLGMEDLLLPSHFSKNPTYRAIEQGLKSVPASQLAAQEHSAISALSQKADDLIEMAGGQQSRVALSDKFKNESINAIDSLSSKAEGIYSEIGSAISKTTPTRADNTIAMLRAKAKTLGGITNLSTPEKMVLSKFDQGTGVGKSLPTYGLVDNIRKQIGAALNKNEGPFKDQTKAELSRLYSAITDDQAAVAASSGMGEKWNLAKSLVSQRKQLEDHMVTALGKDLSGTLSSKLSPAVQNLRKGNVKQFNQLIDATPTHMRQEVVASALNDAFTLGSRKEQQLNIPGFVDWYSGAKRNGSLSAVTKHLPDDATKRLHDLFVVANGIRTAKTSEISTGRIQSLLDQFDKDGGMVSKIYKIGKKAAAAEGASSALGLPGVGAASVIASSISAEKTARTVAADKLISSYQFRNAARLMAGNDSAKVAAARANVEKALEKSNQYKKWAATLEPSERKAIARVGIISWLNGKEDGE